MNRKEKFSAERSECLKRWRDAGAGAVGDLSVLCHHGVLFEKLSEPVENRIDYIINNKPENEVAVRLQWFRPAPDGVAEAMATAWKAYEEACTTIHKTTFPGCPFDYDSRTLVFK